MPVLSKRKYKKRNTIVKSYGLIDFLGSNLRSNAGRLESDGFIITELLAKTLSSVHNGIRKEIDQIKCLTWLSLIKFHAYLLNQLQDKSNCDYMMRGS